MDPQPIVNQPKQANNILMMFVGFFLIMIFGIGGYFLGKSSNKTQVIIPTISPTPSIFLSPTNIPNDPTANWKTFSNNFFSLKYRSDWSINFQGKDNNQDSIFKLSLNNSQKENEIIIFLNKTDQLQNNFLSSMDWKQEETTINNVKATKLTGFGGEGGRLYTELIYFVKDGIYYSILNNDIDSSNSDFHQILSTFKFLN